MEINADSKALAIKLNVETLLKDLSELRDSLLKVIQRPVCAWQAEVDEEGSLVVVVRKVDDSTYKVLRIDVQGHIGIYSRIGLEFRS